MGGRELPQIVLPETVFSAGAEFARNHTDGCLRLSVPGQKFEVHDDYLVEREKQRRAETRRVRR